MKDASLQIQEQQSGSRIQRTVLLALAIMAVSFALGARSWVAFFLAPDVANGSPVGLFTQTDYPAITIASGIISTGRGDQLYDLAAQQREQTRLAEEGYILLLRDDELRYPYPYTPFIALLLTPFAERSPLAGMAVWNLTNIAAYAAGLWFLLSSLQLSTVMRLLLLLGGITSFPFIVNLEQGQSSGVVAFALGAGIALLKRGRDLPAGLLLGLLALKVQWIPVVGLVLLWRWRLKVIGGMAVTGSALTLVAVAVMGVGWLPGLVTMLRMAQEGSRELLLDPMASHSLLGGLVALLGSDAEGAARPIALLVTPALVGLLLYLWRGYWKLDSAGWDGRMALTLLVAIVTNVHLNTHDLSLLALPVALGVSYSTNFSLGGEARRIWIALAWASYLIPSYLLAQSFSWRVRLTTLVILGMVGMLAVTLVRDGHKQQEEA